MNKNTLRTIGGTAVFSLVMSAAIPGISVHAEEDVNQILGADSTELAVNAAESNWASADNVVLVSSESYADAISAVVLSKKLNAPILLTGSSSLNENTSEEISKLSPKNIYIVGGTGVISSSIRTQLKSEGYNLVELGGENRYETNAAVANKLVELGMDPSNVIMVGGSNFSDALSAAPVASAKDEILLLGGNDKTAMPSIISFVKNNNSKVTVIGTNNLISDSTYKTVGAVNRVDGGADRFETNLNVLNAYDSDLSSNKIYVANASGDRYADALIAASLAGIDYAPLVLVGSGGDLQTTNAMKYISSKAEDSTEINVISESGAVDDATISAIRNAQRGIVGDSNTVNSVTAIGLNQIKVVFNTDVDEDSAERVANYQIDGDNLTSTAKAYLQDDNRTVLITFSKPFLMGKTKTFKVKSNILTDDSSSSIAEYEKDITFMETGSPSIKSVTAIGGNKVQVRFSEPIRMDDDDLYYMKINGKRVLNYGINEEYTELKDQSGDWVDGVDLYFNSPLPTGENTFTMPDGNTGTRFDNAANIPIKSQSESFTVESVYGDPKVESVTTDNAGTIYIKYNRPMDTETALDPDNYEINGDTVDVDDSYVNFESGSGDSIVEIKNVGSMLDEGTNTILIESDVEDTFGNNINQTSRTLYYGSSSEKPTVTSANILNSETIRIKFSKDVVRSYATNTGNYTIKDSDGNDISYKLNNVNTITVDGNNNRTFDLKFEDGALNGSRYTLTVENIIDTEAKPNLMDTYTQTLSGMDDEDVKVTEIVKRVDEDNSIVIFFNKTMDEASISNKSNYLFRDGTGEIRDLPGGADVIPSYDDKSVTIDFPSNYSIGSGDTSRDVVQAGVENVVDKDGNSLSLGYLGDISTSSSGGPKMISGSPKMTFSGDDIVVRVTMSEPIDALYMDDFRVDSKKPDSASVEGNDVVLLYKSSVDDGEKVDDIKDCGESTTVKVVSTNSVDVAGRKIRTGSTKVYIPPVTEPDDFEAIDASNQDTIKVAFNQDINTSIENLYGDDFVFTDVTTGKTLSPTAIDVDDDVVIYRFTSSAFDEGDVIKVAASSNTSNISIRSEKHDDAGYTVYSPSSDDLSGYTITAK
jgi:trimeric autotransporter adhesin